MNRAEFRNNFGELITVNQACELVNLGRTKVRQLAEESGAAVKIGASYRIKRKVFLTFIDQNFSVR